MNQIEKSQWINEDSLDQQQYFQSLFSEVCNKHLISATQIEKIQIEIVELLAKQVERFTNGDSSIQIEKAQQILQSTCYNMGVYLKSVADMDRKIEMLQNVKVSDIFYKGMEAVTSLVKSSKASLNILKAECLKIDNAAYRSTLFYGLPEFFHDYEYEFCAFDNPGSIDYPTCNPINNLCGIEFIQEYMKRLKIENDFCRHFTADNIGSLLQGYSKDSKHLLINIYELVLTNVLACKLIGQEITDLNISELDCEWLQDKLDGLSYDELGRAMEDAFDSVCLELNLEDIQKAYGQEAVHLITDRLRQNLKTNMLQKIFISYAKEVPANKNVYKDGEPMNNKRLREFIEEVRDCRLVSDKIAMLQKEVRSLYDLEEVMNECFHGDELNEVFRLLSDNEILVLKKRIKRDMLAGSIKVVDELKEWQKRLLNYSPA